MRRTSRKLSLALMVFAFGVFLASTALAIPGYFPTTLSLNTTGFADSKFTGPPDDVFIGLGGQIVVYDFGSVNVLNGVGQDFNVYEVDWGGPEPNAIDVLVSQNGIDFVSVNSSRAAGIRLEGDSAHGNDNFFYSFDLGALDWVRYIKIDGDGIGQAGGTSAFDLDAIGAIHFQVVPIPGALWLLGSGLAGLAVLRRKLFH